MTKYLPLLLLLTTVACGDNGNSNKDDTGADTSLTDSNTATGADTNTAPISDTNTTPISDTATASINDTNTTPISDTATAPISDTNTAPISDTASAPISDTNTAANRDTATVTINDTNLDTNASTDIGSDTVDTGTDTVDTGRDTADTGGDTDTDSDTDTDADTGTDSDTDTDADTDTDSDTDTDTSTDTGEWIDPLEDSDTYAPCEQEYMIDDFEDGDGVPCENEGRTGEWRAENDGSSRGVQSPTGVYSSASSLTPARGDSQYGIHNEADGFSSWGATVGVYLTGFDARQYGGIGFYIKGTNLSSTRFQAASNTTIPTTEGGACTAGTDCDDHYGVVIGVLEDWVYYEIPWSILSQEGWGETAELNLMAWMGVNFVLEPAELRDATVVWIDDIQLIPPSRCEQECIIRVDKSAQGKGHGRSWTSAFNHLLPALWSAQATAEMCDHQCEVWVTDDEYPMDNTFAPGAVYHVAQNVSLYGGFTGTEGNRNERTDRLTRLVDRELSSGSPKHIITVAQSGIVDGFEIDTQVHGAMKNIGGTISNCRFVGNATGHDGGGQLINEGGTVMNCSFFNIDPAGPAINNDGGVLSGIDVIGCDAISNTNDGVVENCFVSDSPDTFNYSISSVGGTVRNCVIAGNTGRGISGGGAAEITNVSVLGNGKTGFSNSGAIVTNALSYFNGDENLPAASHSNVEGEAASGTNNISIDPGLRDDLPAPTGTWDEVWVAGDYTWLATRTHQWVAGELVGQFVQANIENPRWHYIHENGTNSIKLLGRQEEIDPGHSFLLRSHELGHSSPCIDAGDGTLAPTADLVGATRFDAPAIANTGTGVTADIGALEYIGYTDRPTRTGNDTVPSDILPTLNMALCGNGVVDVGEACDDGNTHPWDGCSAICRRVPDCLWSHCAPICGDGVTVESDGEECDDGNSQDNDGCSSDCRIEPGWQCELAGPVTVSGVFRDFTYEHPDFEPGISPTLASTPGMVAPNLSSVGKPLYIGSNSLGNVLDDASFWQWYSDVPGVNGTTAKPFYFWTQGLGTMVNRYGENGEQWEDYTSSWCEFVSTDLAPCESESGLVCDLSSPDYIGCYEDGSSYYGLFESNEFFDGTPLFFPVDAGPGVVTNTAQYAKAVIPSQFGADGGHDDTLGDYHNFHFTSELRFWTYWDPSQIGWMNIVSDDDTWVFLNGYLVADMGGIHRGASRDFVFTPDVAAAAFIHEPGMVELAIFKADRQTAVSALRLTLHGITAYGSHCSKL